MIVNIEIKRRSPFVGGASFGEVGAYERIDGVVTGLLDPAHPRNRMIALLDQAPVNADGLVAYRSDFVLLRPVDAARGNGRLLYEVNNRGRIMLFANLCAGAAGNQPETPKDLGNALPLRLGFSLLWTGWDPAAPKSTGLIAGCTGHRGRHQTNPGGIRFWNAARRARGVQAGLRGSGCCPRDSTAHADGTTNVSTVRDGG